MASLLVLAFTALPAHAQLAQTITFPAIPEQALTTGPFAPSASASSGLPVTLSTPTPATCTTGGPGVTLVAAGTCTLQAAQGGNGTYSPATPVTMSFSVSAAPAGNRITRENLLPGSPPSGWDIGGAGDASIQGYATDISYAPGELVGLKIDTPSTDYRVDIYRLGWYAGDGARKVATVQPSVSLPQNQPGCLTEPASGLIDCGNWGVSATWSIPSNQTSGIYVAKLVREDPEDGRASHVVFVVRDDVGGSDILLQTSDTTWQAYNAWGGNSLYAGGPGTNPSRAYKVSYNRPFSTRANAPEDWVFNAEFPLLRWLERNGYDVSYTTGIDTHRRGGELLEHDAFVSVGHDEYWSGPQRANVEAARAASVNLVFFSGNEVFWKTRLEPSIDGAATPDRSLVSYKETHAGAKIDPDGTTWTGTWRDARPFNPEGSQPENALTGLMFKVNCCAYPLQVPANYAGLRFWRNTAIASLTPGQTATLAPDTLGYEWDEDVVGPGRPPGLIRLSATTVNVPQYLQDFGSTYAPGTATHHLTLYRHASGALVFGAGTIQWVWGLDDFHDRGSAPPDIRMQQATVNLLADMGVQAGTLALNLVPAAGSTDTTPPVSVITSPLPGATVSGTVTVTGTAADAAGVVAGIEVSVDGGVLWQPASGRDNWTFSFTPMALGSVEIRVRAMDDSGYIETPAPAVTITTTAQACPCKIFGDSSTPALVDQNDSQPVQLGMKLRTSTNGFIAAIRFYKSPSATGPFSGRLWTAAGVLLGTVDFGPLTGTGWREAALPAPVAVMANTTYVVTYHTPSYYVATDSYFNSPPVTSPLRALANGEDGPNGVYSYGPPTAFPTLSYQASNYWVDAVFAESVGPDLTPPAVVSTVPGSNATGIGVTGAITATFNEALDQANVTAGTFTLVGPGTTPVAGAVAANGTVATFTPSSPLTWSTTYTATLKGGLADPRIKDLAGNALAGEVSWSFTTAAEPPPPPTEGPGGPILVISSTLNTFSRYYAEILRAEGLNAFTAMDISLVTPATLAAHDVVILGEFPLNPSQVTLLADWVSAGGNLIAMRPDKQLATVLGLADDSATLGDAYLLMNTATAPAAGLVNQTIQFHGTADRYTLAGASSLATLYASAATATTSPAVTINTYGAGKAAAFAYDLARSVVYTRQGNPAWSAQPRDGQAGPTRSDNLFFGGATFDPQPDWIDFAKVAIPQADEQQRLLANLVLTMNQGKKPLPRFWYLPKGLKAVVVMTGDDHATNGTTGLFNTYLASSPANCSVVDWECVRSTSYIYPNTLITNSAASAFVAQGFEIGLHVTTNCGNWTADDPASLQAFYGPQLVTFADNFEGVPAPRTNRTHCIAWSDYDSQPGVSLANGIRLDTNYYYWPPGWIQDRPGYFTGSGLPMRFATRNGGLVDVYQATTQITDESGQNIPLHITTLLDNAIGPNGWYGVVTANMHTDAGNSVAIAGSAAIVAAAQARGVPVITAAQMLDWLDGRNGSSFGAIAWSGNTLSFTVSLGAGIGSTTPEAQVLLPYDAATGALTGLTRNGDPVAWTAQTIKGVAYAVFSGLPGNYAATYAPDTTPPTISGLGAAPASGATATVTWTTDQPSTSVVNYGTAAGSLSLQSSSPGLTTSHSVTLSGLTASTTYYYTVTSVDGSGNGASAPASPAVFTTPAATLGDGSSQDFAAGSGSCSVTTQSGAGAVILAPGSSVQFDGNSLPGDWSSSNWSAGGAATVGGGTLTVDGAIAAGSTSYGPGRSLEFVATFSGQPFQHVGFVGNVQFNLPLWMIVSTGDSGGGLFARTNNNGAVVDAPIAGNWLNAPHRFRIDWDTTTVVFSIDDTVVSTQNVSIGASLLTAASDFSPGGGALVVDSLALSPPYATPCAFASRIFDAGAPAGWGTLSWTSQTPAGTTLGLSYRVGDTPVPDGSWSAPVVVAAPGAAVSGNGRYFQYLADLTTADPAQTPVLSSVTVGYGAPALLPQTITFGPLADRQVDSGPFAVTATASSGLAVTFSSLTAPVCAVSGTTVSLVTTGTCTVAADQAGSGTYSAAPQVTRSFAVTAVTIADVPVVSFPLTLASPANGPAYRADIGYARLQQELGASIPAGTDVVVSQVETPTTEGGPPAWMPDTLNAEFTGKAIANESNAPAGLYSAYATAVGGDFYGSSRSIAPAIPSIGVFSAGNWLGGGYLQTVPSTGGPAPEASTSRITNHSWVGTASNFDTWVLRRLDWLVETDEAIQVVAVDNGDGNTSNNLGLLTSAYNAIAVGRSDGLQLLGSAGVDGTYIAGRARPDIVDPADSTLSTTPRVAAAAALLVETGHANPTLSSDPVAASVTNRAGVLVRNAERSEVIKAALMAGADRVTHNKTSTNLAAYRGTPANQTDNGLDRRYGAGQLNVRNSYWIIAGGEQGSTEDGNTAATVATRGFDYDPHFGGEGGSNSTATYPLPVQAQPALLTASLAWNLDIAGPAGNDFDATATLRDLNVELIDLGNGGIVVASSASAIEDTENLRLVVPATAQYALRVTRTGSFDWDYALAWQLLPDTDADQAPDDADNCSTVANPTQCDSDDDGFGNRCDGDLNGNGITNAQDTTLFRAQLGQPSAMPTYNKADLTCNGSVNAQDMTLFRGLLGSPPGPSGLQQ